MSKEKKNLISEQDMMNILDATYAKVLDGVPMVSIPVEKMAQDYLLKYPQPHKAAQEMINMQTIKCTTSGTLAGLGGIVLMPVSIPANIGNVLYVQMRMIACTAMMAGYDLKDDSTQTFVYACLAGLSMSNVIKNVGITISQKVAKNLINKIPGSTLTKINQKVGFRMLTKFGETGVINIGKGIPLLGAVVGGGVDFFSTKIIGERAIRWFFEGDFSFEEEQQRLADERTEKREEMINSLINTTSDIATSSAKVVANFSNQAIKSATEISDQAIKNTMNFSNESISTVSKFGGNLLKGLVEKTNKKKEEESIFQSENETKADSNR